MTLLRASIDPDPLPDLGEHAIEYALQPHGAGWAIGDGMRAGEETNVPLAVLSCGFHRGELPSVTSFLRVVDANVRLVALKQGQDGGVVLRLAEVEGHETKARVVLSSKWLPEGTTVSEVDTLERPVESGRIRRETNALGVHLAGHGITAVLIR
jgi:alpha-mannosidase